MEKTWFDKSFEQRMKNPKFAAAYREAKTEIDAVDALVRELDAERARQGLTKARLARLSGLPPESVRRLFTAADPDPKLSTLMPLAAALGRSIALTASTIPRVEAVRRRRPAARLAAPPTTRKRKRTT
jgi:transcriptional regulator with XRE-family HTH domain